MSDSDQCYLQLASIVNHNDWRDDEDLLTAFTLWAHTRFGLAWQAALFSTQTSISQIGSPIQSATLVFKNGVLSCIEIETDDGRREISSYELKSSEIVRILFLAHRVKVSGVANVDLEYHLKQQTDEEQFSVGSGLHKKLMNEYVVAKQGKSRASRLFAKLLKDPVLFFRDSKGVFGRSVYYLLCFVGKEKAL